MTANLSTAAVKVAQRILDKFEEERRNATEIVRRNPNGARTASQREYVLGVARVLETVDSWKDFGRQVLAIHPALIESIRLSGSSELEPRVFETLPYVDPLVVFPDPPPVSNHVNSAGELRVLGFFCAERSCSCGKHTTTAGGTESARELFVLAMLQSSGSLSERAEFTGFSIPISGNPATFDEVVDAIAPKLGVASRVAPGMTPG